MFHTSLSGWFLIGVSDSQSPKVSWSLFSILAYLKNSAVWVVFTRPLFSKYYTFNEYTVRTSYNSYHPFFFKFFSYSLARYTCFIIITLVITIFTKYERQHVPKTLPIILADLNKSVVWMGSILLPISNYSNRLFQAFGDRSKRNICNFYLWHPHVPQHFRNKKLCDISVFVNRFSLSTLRGGVFLNGL